MILPNVRSRRLYGSCLMGEKPGFLGLASVLALPGWSESCFYQSAGLSALSLSPGQLECFFMS